VEELSREQQFVEDLCERLGVPLTVARIPRGRIVAEAGRAGGVEAAARHFRYVALEDVRLETRSDLILTAHTADDWLETMLMRFFGGSGTGGLKGIPFISSTMARPFLGISKEEILAYLSARDQEYSVDSTNLGSVFLRNRIRQDLIPRVLAVFPAALSALKTLSSKARLDDEALETWARSLFVQDMLPASAFFAAPLAVRIRALYRLCLRALDEVRSGGSDSTQDESFATRRIPWAFMEKAASSNPASRILGQGAGLKIHVLDGVVCAARLLTTSVLPAGALPGGFSLEVQAPGRFRIGIALDCRLYCKQEPDGLRLDAFEWPLIVRSRRSGDIIRLSAGSRPLDRLLADLQIPPALRDTVPVLEDRTGLVAVLGSQVGFRDIYRRNDDLSGHDSPGFLVLEMKGVVSDDAVQR
jgi:tRNA(Ile)-lysidine synthase